VVTEYRPLPLAEAYPGLQLIRRSAPGYVEKLERVQTEARDFARRHIDPEALNIDARIAEQPDYFPWEVVAYAAEYGYLSFIVPRMIGGGGQTSLAISILLEELSAHCAGIANIIGAHSLGLAPLAAGGYDMQKYYRFLQDTVRGEHEGRPVLWAFAITEPSGGSDIEDADEVDNIGSITQARRANGGYVLNGRKVFISNGSVARYISVYAAMDRAKPRESMIALVVPNDAPGFSVARVEHKMGQRASPAAELAFDEVYVPDTHRLGAEGDGMVQMEGVLSGSRSPVGAIATGTARGALERAWSYAANKVIGHHRLIEEQWVQIALADMAAEIHAARQAYYMSAMLLDLSNPLLALGISGRGGVGRLIDGMLSAVMDQAPVKALATQPAINKAIAAHFSEKDTPSVYRSQHLRSAMASAAKLLGSDAAMSVSARALDIAGADGSRHELGLEKCFRDAKVTQIYEGTNEINRLNLYKRLSRLGQPVPGGQGD